MELDLNQEPLELEPSHNSVAEIDSLLNELESAHGHIHDRIRHLEAVYTSARLRYRWPPVHTPIQITNFTGEEAVTANDEDGGGRDNPVAEESEVANEAKSKGTHLIAKALGIEQTDASVADQSSASFFDCNICLDIARDPVLTCCGHLFCWPCFYQVSYAYSNAKECPVCKGEVTEKGIIPIYGNGSSSTSNSKLESNETSLKVPPRPPAPRVESIRQQLINQGASSSTIRNLRRFHNLISGRGERVQSETPNMPTGSRNNVVHAQTQREIGDYQHIHSQPILSLLMQGATSFSSLSSALTSAMSSAERLVEDLESYLHGQQPVVSSTPPSNPLDAGVSSLRDAAAHYNYADNLSRVAAALRFAAAAPDPSLSRNEFTVAVDEMRIANDLAQIRASSPSNRRRTSASRGGSNELRRRRLR
ncbi:hypothetical protein PIB30_076018 [Stylosanthes scabra]|uniref:E3 ubiquitin-protein ligase RMA n=1 Tax=Stylosanthes scabra TaxID=79078 RepID=A0ABU6UQT2_9FABA|nr:hypothetical protein [Stylosanthes scabra]